MRAKVYGLFAIDMEVRDMTAGESLKQSFLRTIAMITTVLKQVKSDLLDVYQNKKAISL